MNKESLLTAEQLRELLDYEPATGVFTWRSNPNLARRWNTRYAGKKAGSRSNGYWQISISKKLFYSHRLAWLYVYGVWPEHEIDHRNGIRGDDRIDNLRKANHSENGLNKTKQSNNRSGLKGVSWFAPRNKWAAAICRNGVRRFLGYFPSREAAASAYAKAAAEVHGEFARVE